MSLGVLQLWLEHNIQVGSGFWKAFLCAVCRVTYGQSLSKGAWSHSREKLQVAWFQEHALFFPPTFFPVVRKLSVNLLLYMLFSTDLVKEFSHVLLHASLSAGITKIHFPQSVLFSCYFYKLSVYRFAHSVFQDCRRCQGHRVFNNAHCSVLFMCRQRYCSGLYDGFWLNLGKYVFCFHLCCQPVLWHWSALTSKLWLSFAICISSLHKLTANIKHWSCQICPKCRNTEREVVLSLQKASFPWIGLCYQCVFISGLGLGQ